MCFSLNKLYYFSTDSDIQKTFFWSLFEDLCQPEGVRLGQALLSYTQSFAGPAARHVLTLESEWHGEDLPVLLSAWNGRKRWRRKIRRFSKGRASIRHSLRQGE